MLLWMAKNPNKKQKNTAPVQLYQLIPHCFSLFTHFAISHEFLLKYTSSSLLAALFSAVI